MKLISAIVILVHLESSFGLQEDTTRNQVLHNDALRNHNQEYYYQQRHAPVQHYSQHYVPVPIQLLQRSVYSQQPQAALIIVKAFPVYLSPAQTANLQQQGSLQNAQNIQMIHYNSVPRIPAYTTGQSTETRPVIVPSQHHIQNYAPPVSNNQNLYYTAQNNNVQSNTVQSNTVQSGAYLNQLAQIVAQQYSKSPSSYKTPAIITGLENFSPEQQNQIKSHLKNYIDSHSDENSQQNEIAEHREIMSTSDDKEGKYSSKITGDQYNSHQTEWRPSHQEIVSGVKNFGDKSQ